MERTWHVIRRYGTQSVMKVGLNQPNMREVLGKLMSSNESDGLTESVTEDSVVDYQITKKPPFKRANKGLNILEGKLGSKTVNHRVIKSKANVALTSIGKISRPNVNG